MEDPGQACTCWNIETDNGEPAKMGWLRLHDSVRLVTRDGTSAEGWTHGVDRRRMGGIEGATIALEMCSGGIITVEARDIATITPLSGPRTRIHSCGTLPPPFGGSAPCRSPRPKSSCSSWMVTRRLMSVSASDGTHVRRIRGRREVGVMYAGRLHLRWVAR